MFSLLLLRTAQRTAIAVALSAAIMSTFAGCCSTKFSSQKQLALDTSSSKAGATPGPIQRVPAFRVKDTSGQEISPATLRGKVALLDFWATWCPPCRKEIPHFNSLYEKHRDQGLIIVGLALDENQADVAAFSQQFSIQYPIALAPSDVQQLFGGIEVYPTAFLIDRHRNVIKKYLGFTYPDEFERDIGALINNGKPH